MSAMGIRVIFEEQKLWLKKINLMLLWVYVSDNKIFECVVGGNVNFIIAQDNHLLMLKVFESIKTDAPEEFLERWSNEKDG